MQGRGAAQSARSAPAGRRKSRARSCRGEAESNRMCRSNNSVGGQHPTAGHRPTGAAQAPPFSQAAQRAWVQRSLLGIALMVVTFCCAAAGRDRQRSADWQASPRCRRPLLPPLVVAFGRSPPRPWLRRQRCCCTSGPDAAAAAAGRAGGQRPSQELAGGCLSGSRLPGGSLRRCSSCPHHLCSPGTRASPHGCRQRPRASPLTAALSCLLRTPAGLARQAGPQPRTLVRLEMLTARIGLLS